MNVVLTREVVKASKIEVKGNDESKGENLTIEKKMKGQTVSDNNNKNNKVDGPMVDTEAVEMLRKQYNELLEVNRVLKKQLESRDSIIKRQISDIHRLHGEVKNIENERADVKNENSNLKKDFESERWLTERLKHDIRDLQMQLDFQDCYLQEQSHQSGLMESLLGEMQKRNEAQEKEIIQLRKQLHSGKEKLDNQIVDLQKMLGIRAQSRNQTR